MKLIGYAIGAAIYRIEQMLWHHFGLLCGDYKNQWERKCKWYKDWYEEVRL